MSSVVSKAKNVKDKVDNIKDKANAVKNLKNGLKNGSAIKGALGGALSKATGSLGVVTELSDYAKGEATNPVNALKNSSLVKQMQNNNDAIAQQSTGASTNSDVSGAGKSSLKDKLLGKVKGAIKSKADSIGGKLANKIVNKAIGKIAGKSGIAGMAISAIAGGATKKLGSSISGFIKGGGKKVNTKQLANTLKQTKGIGSNSAKSVATKRLQQIAKKASGATTTSKTIQDYVKNHTKCY